MGLGSRTTPTNTYPRTNSRKLKAVAGFLIATGIGFIGLLNVQPHIELAKQIAKELTNIPFLDSLVQLPFLGGWIQFIFLNLVAILGIVLWGLTQLAEILPMLVDNPSKRLQTYRWIAYGYEAIICFLRFPPYEGGASAVFEEFGRWDLNLIDWWILVLFLVTMFSFELIFVIGREIRSNLR
jgi:hypothetical protein